MVDKPDIIALRREMVSSMRREGALDNAGVEAAFAAVPRHLFLPDRTPEEAYQDRAIALKHNIEGMLTSSSSQPSMMAVMLNQLGLEAGDNVLEIGTATGYNAAIMKHIVGESGSVTSIEIDEQLAQQARENLRSAHARVTVVDADGAQGYAPRASYDHIVSTAGVWDVPTAWLTQVKATGSVVTPIVLDGVQVSSKFVKQADGSALSVDNRPCAFVYLMGSYAGPDFRRQVGSTSLYILADDVTKIDTVALHLLLSDDHEFCQFESALSPMQYWMGYQLYLMLHEPPKFIFLVYDVIAGQKAYGMEGRGIALFSRGSAAFAGYHEKGLVHCYAGSDAYLEMQNQLDGWHAAGRPDSKALRLRLIPKDAGQPDITEGKLWERRDHYIHAWLATESS